MGARELIRRARVEAGLTQTELAARAGTSQSAVARYESDQATPTLPTLERLLRACGRELTVGTAARRDSRPTSVRAATGKRARLLRAKRPALLELLRREGARNPRVFGSVARGEEASTSDIDLLVDLDPAATLLDLVRLQRNIAEVLGAPVDVATPQILKAAVRERAESEAIPL